MIETSRRSFLGGLIGLIAAPSIVTAAGVRPGLWMPPKQLVTASIVTASGAWIGFIDGAGQLVRWKSLVGDDWLPIDLHHEAAHWKRMRFPPGYRNTEQQLRPFGVIHE